MWRHKAFTHLPTSQSSRLPCMGCSTEAKLEQDGPSQYRVSKSDQGGGCGDWMSLWRQFTRICPYLTPACSSGTPQAHRGVLIFTDPISSWLPSTSTTAHSRAFQHRPAQPTETLVLSWGAACNFIELFLRWEKQGWILYSKCAVIVDLHSEIHIPLHSLIGQCLQRVCAWQ